MTTATAATGQHEVPARTRDDGRLPGIGHESGRTTAHGRFFAAGRAQIVDDHDQLLWQVLHEQSQGGKKFRPALLLNVYAALGGQDHQVAAQVGDAIELLHTAFVIHDDVIDGDGLRRGRPNVSGTFTGWAHDAGASAHRARHYGEAAGILAGDLALAGAVREVALCGAQPSVVVRLLDLLEDVLHRSAAGELADVRVTLPGNVSVSDALDIAEWKTAAYSFQLPLQGAAILASAGAPVEHALAQVGRALGVAFQLRDDLDGVFGTVEQTGKDPLCDLREGKSTALIVAARSTPLWGELAPYVGDPDLTSQGAQHARDLLQRCGAREWVETLVSDLRTAALVGAAELPAHAEAVLTAMIERLLPPPLSSTSTANDTAQFARRIQGAA